MDTSHTGCHTGLWVANINNVPTLIGLYSNATNNQTYYVTWDGTNWNEASLGFGTYLIAPPRDLLWNNILYIFGIWNDSNKGGHVAWNPLTNNVTSINANTITNQKITRSAYRDAVVSNNKLFQLAFSGESGSGPAIFQLIGSAWQRLVTFDTTNTSPQDDAGPALFIDNGYMYAFYYYSNASAVKGWRMHKLDLDGNDIADITSTVVPSILSPGNFSASNGTVAYIFTDQTTGTVVTYIILATDFLPGQAYTLYQFNGPSSVMTVVGSGVLGDVAMAPPHTKVGGGNRLYRSGQLTLDEISLVSISTGIRISFKAYGGSQANVQFFFSTNGGVPSSACTLANPSAGTVSGSHLLQDINCDGTTLHTVDWPFEADGVTGDSFINVVGKVFN